jgi:hypothetical protein
MTAGSITTDRYSFPLGAFAWVGGNGRSEGRSAKSSRPELCDVDHIHLSPFVLLSLAEMR